MHQAIIFECAKGQDHTIFKIPWIPSCGQTFWCRLHHKNCQRWLKEDWDRKRRSGKHHRKNRKGQGRKVSYPKELEDQLVKWILQKREHSHIPVSREMIRLKGLSLIKPSLPNFKASQGWLKHVTILYSELGRQLHRHFRVIWKKRLHNFIKVSVMSGRMGTSHIIQSPIWMRPLSFLTLCRPKQST